MNLPPDRYHTKANTELDEKKRDNSFINQLDQGRICGQMQDVSTGKGKSSCYSAMPRARGLKFYYVIADPKVGE